MLKSFAKDRRVCENFFENGEGINKLVRCGLLQLTTGSDIVLWRTQISEGATWSSQSDWYLTFTVACYWNTLLSISCSWAWSSDWRKHRHLLSLPGKHLIALAILRRSRQTSRWPFSQSRCRSRRQRMISIPAFATCCSLDELKLSRYIHTLLVSWAFQNKEILKVI